MKFFLSRIGIPKYLNMHKSRYKLAKKRNRCEVTIKSTITKGTIRGKKMCLKQLKKKSKERKLEREREREERELTFFVMNNLEGIWERGGNEVKEIYRKIKLEEEE